MLVVLINTSSKKGGAAIACRRLLKALNYNGTTAIMLVRDEAITENMVSTTHSKLKKWINFYRFAYERFFFFVREKSKSVRFLFSIANVGEDIHKRKEVKQADIIHFHWINEGFISITGIKEIFNQKKPVVWTLHDMWPF
ncbi:MAG TPA: glycosyl transferase, partial [Bacteroidales bacterium]